MPAPLLVRKLEKLTEQQIQEAAELCTQCFDGDVAMGPMLGDDWTLHYEFQEAAIRAANLDGEIYAVQDNKGKMLSLAVWMPFTKPMFDTKAQRELGFIKFFEKLSPEGQLIWLRIYPEAMEKLLPRLGSHEESSSIWWCDVLVTDPQYRHNGYATALLNHKFNQASSNGGSIALSTSGTKNVKFYQKAGMQEVGSTTINGINRRVPFHILRRT